jgi:predicted deacylase
MTDPLVVAGKQVPRGSRATIEIPVIRRYARNEVQLPAEVVNGSGDGPRLFLCAAIHGDELNGVEIIRRVLRRVQPRRLNGALLAVPIVNIYGFVSLTRYLPDSTSTPVPCTGPTFRRCAPAWTTPPPKPWPGPSASPSSSTPT